MSASVAAPPEVRDRIAASIKAASAKHGLSLFEQAYCAFVHERTAEITSFGLTRTRSTFRC